jgi:hypothetical protein
MITRQTSLSKNIVQFCRFLRHTGFGAGIEEEVLSLRALEFIDYDSNEIFHAALKARKPVIFPKNFYYELVFTRAKLFLSKMIFLVMQ